MYVHIHVYLSPLLIGSTTVQCTCNFRVFDVLRIRLYYCIHDKVIGKVSSVFYYFCFKRFLDRVHL